MILPRCQRKTFGHWESFCLSSSVQVLPLDLTTPRDSYTWNYREMANLLTHSKWKFSWWWVRITNHRINAQESYHWAILTPFPPWKLEKSIFRSLDTQEEYQDATRLCCLSMQTFDRISLNTFRYNDGPSNVAMKANECQCQYRLCRSFFPFLAFHESYKFCYFTMNYWAFQGQCRNLHVGVPEYRPPKVISTHFCRLVTDSATTSLKAHLRERVDEEVGFINFLL